jgi:hypothetical protein
VEVIHSSVAEPHHLYAVLAPEMEKLRGSDSQSLAYIIQYNENINLLLEMKQKIHKICNIQRNFRVYVQ